MFHDDLEVKVSGPYKKYPHHLLHIASTGPYSLSVGNADTNCWIHRLDLDNLRLIRDVIDNHLAEYLPKEAPKVECRLCSHLQDVVPGKVKTYGMKCELGLRPETCDKFEDERNEEAKVN